MPRRTHKAAIARIESLRIKRGWAIADLAQKACVATRTIDNVMSGKPVVITTLRKLAKALDVPLESLLDGFEEPPTEILAPKRGEIIFTVGGDYDDVKTIVQYFVELLKTALPSPGEIVVKSAKQGSIIITLEMDEKDIVALAEMFMAVRSNEPIRFEGSWYFGKDTDKNSIRVFVGSKPSSIEGPNFYAVAAELGALRCITSMKLPDSATLPDDLRGKTLKLVE